MHRRLRPSERTLLTSTFKLLGDAVDNLREQAPEAVFELGIDTESECIALSERLGRAKMDARVATRAAERAVEIALARSKPHRSSSASTPSPAKTGASTHPKANVHVFGVSRVTDVLQTWRQIMGDRPCAFHFCKPGGCVEASCTRDHPADVDRTALAKFAKETGGTVS